MVGYDPSKGQAGRPTADEIKRKTIDFMTIEAVYALFDRNTPIYIGEGILGKRIAAHFYDEEKVGRWDSFSWLSPWSISDDQKTTPTLLPWTTSDHLVVEGKRLVELLEITTIFLAAPATNRQLPEDSKKIKWITQVRHEKAEGTLQNKIDYIVQTLGSANAANPKAQPRVPKKAATSISAPIGQSKQAEDNALGSAAKTPSPE
jgi:hypothetical protein